MASDYNEAVSADADDVVSAIDDEEDHIEEKRAQARAIFDTFDQERSGLLDASEASHVVRCLGFKPTQRDLSRFLDQLVKDGSSRITFEHLFARLLAVSENGEWHFGEPVELERAFAALAPQGTISKEHLMDLLTSRGEALNASEMKELVGHIGVRRNGDVDWRGYIQQVVDYTRQNNPPKPILYNDNCMAHPYDLSIHNRTAKNKALKRHAGALRMAAIWGSTYCSDHGGNNERNGRMPKATPARLFDPQRSFHAKS